MWNLRRPTAGKPPPLTTPVQSVAKLFNASGEQGPQAIGALTQRSGRLGFLGGGFEVVNLFAQMLESGRDNRHEHRLTESALGWVTHDVARGAGVQDFGLRGAQGELRGSQTSLENVEHGRVALESLAGQHFDSQRQSICLCLQGVALIVEELIDMIMGGVALRDGAQAALDQSQTHAGLPQNEARLNALN